MFWTFSEILLSKFVGLLLFYFLRVFHTIVSWWTFTGVLVTANQLKFPGFFFVFQLTSTVLRSGWSWFILEFPAFLQTFSEFLQIYRAFSQKLLGLEFPCTTSVIWSWKLLSNFSMYFLFLTVVWIYFFLHSFFSLSILVMLFDTILKFFF